MSKIYYISDVIGDGSMDSPFRAKAQDGVINGSQSVITPNLDGTPKFSWAISIIDADSHTGSIAGVDRLPNIDKGNILSSLTQLDRTSITNAIARTSATTRNDMSYEDVIDLVGKILNPSFDVSKFRTQ